MRLVSAIPISRACGMLSMMFLSGMCFASGPDVADVAATASLQVQADVDGDTLGRSVAFVGDVNGDGRPDMLVGASSDDGSALGARAYVVFGTGAGGLPPNLDLAALDGTNGFVLKMAQTGTRLGFSVAALGDINDDGRDDFAIGAPMADAGSGSAVRHYAGRVFVVFGRDDGDPFPASMNVETLDGNDGFSLSGIFSDDRLGHALASAGDFNGDGIPDLLLGTFSTSGANDGWIVLGSNSGFPSTLDLTSLASGGKGFRLLAGANTEFTQSLAGIGDLDGDGMDDVLIGAPASTVGGKGNAGRVYVVHGRTTSSAAGANVLSLDPPGSNDVQRLEDVDGYFAGAAVAGLGDVNGDSVPDFMVGVPGRGGYVGAAWIVFGSSTLASGTFQAMRPLGQATLIADSNGGYNTNLGVALAGGRDFDGDGIDDIAIGEPGGVLRPAESRNGSVYVVPGKKTGNPWPLTVDLASLDPGMRLDGVTDIGPSAIGDMRNSLSLAFGPDINGDGKSGLLIGSPLAKASTNDKTHGPWQGRVWLISGQSAGDVIFKDGFDTP